LPLFDRNSLKLGLMPIVNDLAVSTFPKNGTGVVFGTTHQDLCG
jgi:hypothetical protein